MTSNISQSYWKQHYVVETDPDKIAQYLQRTSFLSDGKPFELIYYQAGTNAPTILISHGSGGHAYVFAELGYHLHLRGYNVCIMPKHSGVTIRELLPRHKDALEHIAAQFNDRIGGVRRRIGWIRRLLPGLTESPMKSIVLQNVPAF